MPNPNRNHEPASETSLALRHPTAPQGTPLPAGRGDGGEDPSPREQAFALYCRGLCSPAIAARLGLPERTIRRWLRAIRADVASLRHADRAAELTRAIESQRAVVAAAWDAYEREHQIEDALLAGHYDRLRRRAYYPSTANVDADSPPPRRGGDAHVENRSPSPRRERGPGGEETLYEDFERPHRLNLGARYLAVIVAAQREIARLQGLHDLLAEQPPTDIQITITRRPDGPENFPPESRPRPIAPDVTSADEDEEDEDEEDQ